MKLTKDEVKKCEQNLITIGVNLHALGQMRGAFEYIFENSTNSKGEPHKEARSAAERAMKLIDRSLQTGVAHSIELDIMLTAHEKAVEAEEKANADILPIEKGEGGDDVGA